MNVPVPKNLILEITTSIKDLERQLKTKGQAQQLFVPMEAGVDGFLDTDHIVDSYAQLLRTFQLCDPEPHVALQQLGASPSIFKWPASRQPSPIEIGVTKVLANL